MKSKIFYKRDGIALETYIATRLLPNPLAVKFKVLAKELSTSGEFIDEIDKFLLDELLDKLNIDIVDVVPVK